MKDSSISDIPCEWHWISKLLMSSSKNNGPLKWPERLKGCALWAKCQNANGKSIVFNRINTKGRPRGIVLLVEFNGPSCIRNGCWEALCVNVTAGRLHFGDCRGRWMRWEQTNGLTINREGAPAGPKSMFFSANYGSNQTARETIAEQLCSVASHRQAACCRLLRFLFFF